MARVHGVLRLFVAAYPPADAAEAMISTLSSLPLAPHTPTQPQHLHLTLQFVGDTWPNTLDEVLESVRRSAARMTPLSLQPLCLRTLPPRGSPRLLAIETSAPPELVELHRRLAQRLAPNVRQRGKPERFLPHLTVCRFHHDARADPAVLPLDLPPFRVDSIRAMKSRLRPGGAVHDVVEEVRLGA